MDPAALPHRARELFVAALRADPAERGAFLAESCAGNEALRRRVRELLDAHDQAGSFLQSPAASPDPAVTAADVLSERPGTVIGRYKLLERIGEGGFGVVYMAEQTQPVQRRVALKVVKAGMDTTQ